ncbi:hypothetical protein RAA17_17810 [Komagataeibacter rhaeticus]|nr:hypothetical protein [Komagataeibacter rhaeticus]
MAKFTCGTCIANNVIARGGLGGLPRQGFRSYRLSRGPMPAAR